MSRDPDRTNDGSLSLFPVPAVIVDGVGIPDQPGQGRRKVDARPSPERFEAKQEDSSHIKRKPDSFLVPTPAFFKTGLSVTSNLSCRFWVGNVRSDKVPGNGNAVSLVPGKALLGYWHTAACCWEKSSVGFLCLLGIYSSL
ncbi:hypothetical protein J6590_073863 [Homalodisca vitripennis]|nr:hypothetical protein J6590_073863 [Homalodisca vitripennis]